MPSPTMKAAVCHAYGEPLQIEHVPVPEVPPGRILVQVAAGGVCHTDLHAINGDWPVKATLPLILGHEGVGTVVALGTGVTAVQLGDRVGVPWLFTACGHCEYCRTGWETLCEKQQNTGYSVPGSYAEYVLADPDYVGLLPDNLSFQEAAPILCAGVTVYKGLKETEVKPGQWVVISGVGGLGHLAVQYARAMGMRVAAVDIRADQLALARSVGAELVVNAAEEDAVAVIQERIGGAHGVLVTAPSQPAFAQGVAMLRRRGTLALVGLPPGSFELSIFDMVLTRKTVRGSIVGTRQDLTESLAFAAQGKVKVHYHCEPLENINQVLDAMKAGTIEGRVVLDLTAAAPLAAGFAANEALIELV
ncbi:alcohol dehydrogenase AdhP [Hymenobacter sp. DH14]|uniref:alcohol dehydrogenase n=1 Tax=Hymenobacter cyanobacteriorum TaxID=2926463 RepID=A0A9X1VM28_9BACT|nr:alcohol dehydrogenase AdhP [Hymenobacter cyanobacteriorum]MCI1188636.1 alcohol dehydrogenase AdhP [Hymenobacter cyanobacteriorum]